jgi:ribosomal protein L11 methyltransferase
MIKYLKLIFQIPDESQELLIAELMDMDFYGFEQFDDKLIAYVESSRFNDTNREYIEQIVTVYPGASFVEMDGVEEKNWNESWEQTIRPQQIGRFLVRPTWSHEQTPKDKILLEIDPKMAFGTGYHATTRLMLRKFSDIDFLNKTVLDAGTGTGILAIAAIKLGAKKAVGFDIDTWSQQNAFENALINGVETDFDIRLGGFEQVRKQEQFDITVANINRNVILEYCETLIKHTKPSGVICLSGLLESDESIIRDRLNKLPVHILGLEYEEEWILFHLEKTGE